MLLPSKLNLCSFIVGGLVGISFASSGLSQIIRNDNGDFEIYPNGTVPIAAFLKNATLRMPTVNATTVTFAETSEDTGKDQRSSRGCVYCSFQFFISN